MSNWENALFGTGTTSNSAAPTVNNNNNNNSATTNSAGGDWENVLCGTVVRLPPKEATPPTTTHLKKPPPSSNLKKPPPPASSNLKPPPPTVAAIPPAVSNNNTNNQTSSTPNWLILHVYELQPNPEIAAQQQQLSTTDRALLFVSGMLPTIGMGAYHTSLEVTTTNSIYTFVGNVGIVVSKSAANELNTPGMMTPKTLDTDNAFVSKFRHNQDIGVPNGGSYKQSILLGPTFRPKDEIVPLITSLQTLEFFTATSYNFLYRNCNHFTEVLATALLMTEPPKKETARLLTYPKWLNRLANTGAFVCDTANNATSTTITGGSATGAGSTNGVVPCNVLQEARIVAGY